MTLVVGIPIKAFGVAKARLAPVLTPAARSRVGKAIAAHTAAAVAASGARPLIVTADPGVTAWARRLGWPTMAEPAGGGLNAAATAVAAAAGARSWAVLLADLPIVLPEDLAAAWRHPPPLLAPSRDGGTSLITGTGPFLFSFGRGSFHRHLAYAPHATVLIRPGLALDLDTPRDLAMALQLREGRWLAELLATAESGPGSLCS